MPSSVVVGPVTYRISDLSEHWRSARAETGMGLHNHTGVVWPEQSMIMLDPQAPVQVQRVTLLHELLHAVADNAGYRKGKLSGEAWCSMLDAGLLDVLRRNPDVVAWLVEAES